MQENHFEQVQAEMTLACSRYVVVDVETSGLTKDDKVIEVAAVRFEHGSPREGFHTLVNPRRSINCEASAAHHITSDDLANAPFMEEVEGPLREFVGDDVVVAHNAAFDRGHLSALQDRLWICSYRLARHLWPDAPRYKNWVLLYWLGAAAQYLKGMSAHRALADCLATGLVFQRELRAYDMRFGHGLSNLNEVAEFARGPIRVERLRYFDKYRNQRIAEIPTSYLQWVLDRAAQADQSRPIDADTLASIKWELLTRSQAAA